MVFFYDKYGSFRIFECFWLIMRGEVVINLWCGVVDDFVMEFEGDGNVCEVIVVIVVLFVIVLKKEVCVKGVLKLKFINYEGFVKNEFILFFEYYFVVEV